MQFRIADTFTDSLAELTGKEQTSAKTTAFDLQMNPAHPRMRFHKLDRAKDKNFWSVRVSSDLRLIVHGTETKLLKAGRPSPGKRAISANVTAPSITEALSSVVISSS